MRLEAHCIQRVGLHATTSTQTQSMTLAHLLKLCRDAEPEGPAFPVAKQQDRTQLQLMFHRQDFSFLASPGVVLREEAADWHSLQT